MRFAGGGEAEGESAASRASSEGGAGDVGGTRFNGRGLLGISRQPEAAYCRSLLRGRSRRGDSAGHDSGSGV